MIPGATHNEPLRIAVDLRRYLVFDEALPIRRKLQEILYRTGISSTELRVTGTRDEALETFAIHHPHVVFMELPGAPGDGLEMVLEMLEVDPQVRIVLVTAESQDSAVVRSAVRAGVFAVISKPLRHEKVRQVIAELDAEEGGIERFR